MQKIMLKCVGKFYSMKSEDLLLQQKSNIQLNFVEKCFEYLGIKISWSGKGINEKAKIKNLIKINILI